MSLIATDGYGVFDLDQNINKVILVQRFKARILTKYLMRARFIPKMIMRAKILPKENTNGA